MLKQVLCSSGSSDFQLFSTDYPGLGVPVAANKYFAVISHPIRTQILLLLAGFAKRFPGGFVGDDSAPRV